MIGCCCSDGHSYMISIGVLDKLSQYLGNVRGPIDNDPVAAEFLHCTIALLTSLVRLTARGLVVLIVWLIAP